MKIILTHIQGSRIGTKSEYDGPLVRIGRDPKECEIVFNSVKEPGVSRVHAQVSVSNGEFYLEDMNSRNGTYLDSRPIRGRVPLTMGSLIQLGVEGPIIRFEYVANQNFLAPETRAALAITPEVVAASLSASGGNLSSRDNDIAYCSNCSLEIRLPAKFCRKCGTSVINSAPISSSLDVTVVPPSPPAQAAVEPQLTIPEDAPLVRTCNICSGNIMGEPRFCPSCGALVTANSTQVNSEDLNTLIPPKPAATAYVPLGKQKDLKRLKMEIEAREQSATSQSSSPMLLTKPKPAGNKLLNNNSPNASPQNSSIDAGTLASSNAAVSTIIKGGSPASSLGVSTVLPSSFLQGSNNLMESDTSKTPPTSPGQTLLLSAKALAKKGHIPQAIEECERALRLDSQLPQAYNFLGQLFLVSGENNKAITALDKALKLQPNLIEAYTNQSYAYLRVGRYDEVISTAGEAIKRNRKIPEAYYTTACALMEMGKYDQSLTYFNKATELRANYAEAYLGMATLHFRSSRVDDAIDYCRLAIKERATYSQAYCLLGQAYRIQKDFLGAEESLKEAIRLKPKYAAAYNYLALNYRSQGQLPEAEQTCQQSIKIDARLPESRNTLGLIYCDMGKYEEGIKEYQKAIELRPRYTEAYSNLGLCFFKLGQLDEAVGYFEKAISIDPRFVLARFNLALCYFKKRDKYGVKKQYEVLCGLDRERAAKLYQKIKNLLAS